MANSCIWDNLQSLPSSCWCLLRYEDLIKEPKKVIGEIREFVGLSFVHNYQLSIAKEKLETILINYPSPCSFLLSQSN